MTTFAYRIKFYLSEHDRINQEGKEFQLQSTTNGQDMVLKAVANANIKDTNELCVIGTGFTSPDEAYQCGIKVKNAIHLTGAVLRIGIDVGKDDSKKLLDFTVYQFKDKVRNCLHDVHGLLIYKDEPSISFISVHGNVTIGVPANRFDVALSKAINVNISEKHLLALELYNMSRFESSLRARLITLVTAVESLIKRQEIAPAMLCHIDKLIQYSLESEESQLSEDQKRSIIKSLEDLKKESIARSCRQFVKRHMANEAKDFFHSAYDIRSRMLHDGLIPVGVNLGQFVPKLDNLVSQLIVKDLDPHLIAIN